ncbi:MAG: hypothetical protein IKR48_09875 [Kiritimatiellae bacterium]|nr:hypothetical protein [Kiritimatiellia bacterium]
MKKWVVGVVMLLCCEGIKIFICILCRALMSSHLEEDLPTGVFICNGGVLILGVAYCLLGIRLIMVKDGNERRGLLFLLASLSSTGAMISILSFILMIYQRVAVIGI